LLNSVATKFEEVFIVVDICEELGEKRIVTRLIQLRR